MSAKKTLIWKFILSEQCLFIFACGGSNTSDTGVITSPNYPYNYYNNDNCVWTITVDYGKTITLTFTDFHLEYHSSVYTDYVEVRDGSYSFSDLIGRYDGDPIPDSITTSGSSMYVQFISDDYLTYSGFRATWSTAVTCTLCSWTSWNSFGICNGTCGGGLRIRSRGLCCVSHWDSTTCLSFCGHEISESLSTSVCTRQCNNRGTDSGDTCLCRPGYTGTCCDSGCGGSYTEDTGVITSPNYPGYYNNGDSCEWIVTVDTWNVISLTFTSFYLENMPSYSYRCSDYVEVRDGNSDTSTFIGRYCGFTIPDSITTTSNSIYLKFISNSYSTYSGFRATWSKETLGCGGSYTDDTGVITSPNYPGNYNNGDSCEWIVTVATWNVISLTFTTFRTEGSTSCVDHVEVRDGNSDTSTFIGRYCGFTTPDSITTTSNIIYVKFSSDSSITYSGFRATWSIALSIQTSTTTAAAAAAATTKTPQTTTTPPKTTTLPPPPPTTTTKPIDAVPTRKPSTLVATQSSSTASTTSTISSRTTPHSFPNVVETTNAITESKQSNSVILIGVGVGSGLLVLIISILIVIAVILKRNINNVSRVASPENAIAMTTMSAANVGRPPKESPKEDAIYDTIDLENTEEDGNAYSYVVLPVKKEMKTSTGHNNLGSDEMSESQEDKLKPVRVSSDDTADTQDYKGVVSEDFQKSDHDSNYYYS